MSQATYQCCLPLSLKYHTNSLVKVKMILYKKSAKKLAFVEMQLGAK